MSQGSARVRLFVIKEDPDDGNGFEVLEHAVFKDGLLSTPTPVKETHDGRWKLYDFEIDSREILTLTDVGWVQDEISNIGWDGVEEDINETLKSYAVEDVVEIIADYVIKGYWSHGYDGDEYDSTSHLENIQHNKLRDNEIKRFVADFDRDKEGRIVFKNNDTFNHGLDNETEK